MKKILLIVLISQLTLFAKSSLVSNIPLPKTYIQNLDPYPCDEQCMQTYLDNGMIFSFLSHASTKLSNQQHDQMRMMHVPILNLGSQIVSKKVKIALMLPYKVIGRYAASTTNASLAYLMARNNSFELKSYKLNVQNEKEIAQTIKKIQDDGFSYVIAPLTQKGASILVELNPEINIYFPTINKKDLPTESKNIFFGGIDYRAQSDMLLKKAISPLVIFYDKSSIGKKLSSYEKFSFIKEQEDEGVSSINKDKSVIQFSIPRRVTNLKKQLKDNEDIQWGSFFINTPIVKSGMIMSQLTLYDTNATNLLSTQINYDPLILSMTQYKDRKKMIIANSITEKNNVLIETNAILDNDIVYDWINYTTTIGIDYFFHLETKENREYSIKLENNQMLYPIKLTVPSVSKFIQLGE